MVKRPDEPNFASTERFEISRRLGGGGMGAVYEAYDRERGTTVALKTLHHADARARERLGREFQALRDLQHPNLVRFGELVLDADPCFFTMELVVGSDFVSHVRPPAGRASGQATTYDEPRLRAALVQLAQGISAIHRGGKLHRDIKPANILVTAAGRVVVLDFGLVTALTPGQQSSADAAVGTAAYMAPEQALASELSPAADWYALGVVLYESLTGSLPYTGATRFELLQKKQRRTPPPPRQRVPGVAADLDELCVDLLRIEAACRPLAPEILERLGVVDATLPRETADSAVRALTPSTPFVGRQQELAILATAYQDSRRNGPVSVLIHGESGLGKTELAAQFLRTLTTEDPDVVVLTGRCQERAAVPYGAFSGIADCLSRLLAGLPDAEVASFLPRRAGLLPTLFPVLLQVRVVATAAVEHQTGLDPHEWRTRMFAAFRELLARLARDRRVVVLIDDLQWAAPDTLALLAEVMQAADAPALLLVGTARPGVENLLETRVSGDVRHVHLEELSTERAWELVTELAPSIAPEQAQAIADEAVGHPMFIQELVRHLASGGVAGSMRLDEALWLRISELEPSSRRLLEILVVAQGPIAQEAATVAAGLSYARYERAVRELRIGCLARTGRHDANTIEPYHDRVRDALLGHLDESSRARCHRELGIALERSGAGSTDPQILVVHFTAADEPLRAAKHAVAAAHRARAMSAFDQAADLFRTVLQLGVYGDTEARTLRLSLAEVLVAAGKGPEAADVFLLAAEGASALVRLDCKRQAAEQLLISGHLERGFESMERLLAEVGVGAPATPRRALISLLWQRAKLRIRGLGWKQKTESQIPPNALTRVDVYKAAADGYGVIDVIRGADFHARGLLLALRTGEQSRVARALFYESIFVGTGGPKRLGRARALLAEGTRIADSLDDPYLEAWKIAGTASLQYFGGRFRVAAKNFATAEYMFREQAGANWELSSMRLLRCWSLHRRGALAELAPLLRDYVRDAERRGDRYARTTLVRSCHRVLLGRTAKEARDELERADWVPAEGRYHLQHWYLFASRAEFSLYENNSGTMMDAARENDRRIQQALLLRVQSVRVDFQWLRARLILANAAQSSSRSAELRKVKKFARRLTGEGVGYASVAAKLLLASVAVQQSAPDRACEVLRVAVQQAEEEDMLLHAGAAQCRLGELLGGDEGAQLIGLGAERMKAEGATDVPRMTEMLVPGFTAD